MGGIIGVTSKSTDTSIRLYKGRSHYNEWAFVYTLRLAPEAPAGRERRRRRRPGTTRTRPESASRTRHRSPVRAASGTWRRARARARVGPANPAGGGLPIPVPAGQAAAAELTTVKTSGAAVWLALDRIVKRATDVPHVLERSAAVRAIGQQHEVAIAIGSIHSDVPVKPTWPNAAGDIRVPHDEVGSIVSQPSARELPGTRLRASTRRRAPG